MTTIADPRDDIHLPNGWTVRILPTLDKFLVYYAECDGELARFTVNAIRCPQTKELEVRHRHGCTAEERAKDLELLVRRAAVDRSHRLPGLWSRFKRNSDGKWAYRITLGEFVEDPLIQLELEMMIDLSTGVTL